MLCFAGCYVKQIIQPHLKAFIRILENNYCAMRHLWDILTYLIDGCAISLVLFLVASVFIAALKSIRPEYLRIANTIFSTLGLMALGISIVLYSMIIIDLTGHEFLGFLALRAKYILAGLLLLSVVPIMAFFQKRAANTGFTFLLLVSVIMITHADAVAQAVTNMAGIYGFADGLKPEAPLAKWYRLIIALLFFAVCYWQARRQLSRA